MVTRRRRIRRVNMFHEAAAGGSAERGASAMVPSKHRLPLKWKEHKQRAPGAGRRAEGARKRGEGGVVVMLMCMFILDLVEGGCSQDTKGTKGSERGPVAASMTFWCFRYVSKVRDGMQRFPLYPMTFTFRISIFRCLPHRCAGIICVFFSFSFALLRQQRCQTNTAAD